MSNIHAKCLECLNIHKVYFLKPPWNCRTKPRLNAVHSCVLWNLCNVLFLSSATKVWQVLTKTFGPHRRRALSQPPGRKSKKVSSVDLAPSTVNKSSRPLLEPWMCWIPALFWFCREVFTHCSPTEPEEGLKIDESSQNQFIALEILACVMSGKIVLLFCLIEVHEAGTAHCTL